METEIINGIEQGYEVVNMSAYLDSAAITQLILEVIAQAAFYAIIISLSLFVVNLILGVLQNKGDIEL